MQSTQSQNHSQTPEPNKHKKLRTACDICHQAKMKCSGGTPCNGCRDSGYECSYSVSNRIGRPKGTKNKRTLERMSRNQSENDRENKARNSSGTDQGLGIQPGSIAFDNDMHMGSGVTDNMPFDSMFGTNSSYPLPSSNTFEPFSDNFNSWYDFSDMSGMSTLNDQSSLGSSYDSGAFLHEDLRSYAQDDSAYVSPSSVFNDSGSAASSGPDWSGVSSNISSDNGGQPDVSASTSSSSIPSLGTCNCVQNHAELLCRLKDLEQRNTMPRLDVVLSAAQQALVPWKEVIECHVCQNDDNQEVLVLSGMSIRTILRALSPLCVDYYNHFISSGEAIRRQQPPVSTPDDMKSTIGSYRISGDERMAVTDLLISRCLDQVKLTLACFKTRLETMKARKATTASMSSRKRTASDVEVLSRGGPGDLDHLLQLWQNLENTVQMLEGIMRKGIVAPKRASPRL